MKVLHILCLAALLMVDASSHSQEVTSVTTGSHSGKATVLRQVAFRYENTHAEKVAVAGSFNDWNSSALPMTKIAGSVFATTVPLALGTYQYKFVVNGGDWQPDPANPLQEDDGQGAMNSVLHVGDAGAIASVPGRSGPTVEVLGGGKNRVTFTYKDAQAEKVYLAGSFNFWHPTKDLMTRTGDAHTTTILLEDGEHQYKFVVNGVEWIPDPANREGADDGNEGQNSLLRLGPASHIQNSQEQPGDGKLATAVFQHDPKAIEFLNPLPTGETIIKLRTRANDTTSVQLLAAGTSTSMEPEYADARFEYFSGKLPASGNTTAPREMAYTIAANDSPAVAVLGRDGVKTEAGATVAPFTRSIKSEDIFTTPEWAKRVVWYEIFPSRFRNGNPENDPKTAAEMRPWTSDWYKQGLNEQGPGLTPGAFDRRYGGDLQGVLEKLPYLTDLGIGAIWFNPVFKAESLHKYDTADYRHIDDNFGTGNDDYAKTIAKEDLLDSDTWIWSESDKLFLEVIKQAHAKRIRVIVDGVFNHTGNNHPAFLDLKMRGQQSPYKDWYQVKSWEPFEYEGWAGFGGLPVFKENEKGFVSPTLKEHLMAVTRRWMDPNGDGDPSDGIDGWRLDVPNEVSSEFWKDWRDLVKSINPDALIMGEIWDPPANWLRGDQFDCVMNYQMAKALHRFFVNRGPATRLEQDFARMLHEVPDQANHVMMNLMNSHDTDRLISQLNNPNRDYDARNRQQDVRPGEYSSAKPAAEVYRRMKQLVAVQFCYVGSPMIFYGDEVGMWGADDPEVRKPMLWKDLQPYEKPEENFVMDDVHAHFRKCTAIRNTLPALHTGDYEPLLADDSARVFAFRRFTPKQEVVVVTNDLPKAQEVTIPLGHASKPGEYIDLLNDPAVSVYQAKLDEARNGAEPLMQLQTGFGTDVKRLSAGDRLVVRLEPHSSAIFLRMEGRD